MGRGDTFLFYNYTSDDTTQYLVKLSVQVANEGTFGSSINPPTGPVWPYGAKAMRHVWGKAANGKRARLPLATSGNPLYVSGGQFTLGGTPYAIEGQIGEARRKNHIA